MPEFLTDLRYAREPVPARTNSPAPGVRTGFAGPTVPCTIKLQTMNRITAILTLLLSFLAASSASAQPLTLDANDLPEWRENTRSRTTHFPVKHPSLSLNGFDCASNCDHGLGLKQVLEKVYNAPHDKRMRTTWKKVIENANEQPQRNLNITSAGDVRDNSQILQSRALVALTSYVLEQNGVDPTTLAPETEFPDLPDAESAIDSLTAALTDTHTWRISEVLGGDAVKWTTTLMNLARAVDLYLALENAFYEYDALEHECLHYSDNLLTLDQKARLMAGLEGNINTLRDMRLQLGGLVSRYEVESGNAPLKISVAVAYAALVWQPYNNTTDTGDMEGFVEYAFDAAGAPATGDDRFKYWRYQSSDGQKYWAEGAYYLHFALADVVPFWHAARINGLLSGTTVHDQAFPDPFNNSWFLNPLHWLADTATPDGKTMPLDDGNKYEMDHARLLGWASGYGDGVVGNKFAWVTADHEPLPDLYPVELAIPYQAKPAHRPLAELVGNTFADRFAGGTGRQEVVLRKTLDGKEHYVVLNGESGDAITRGEGHEQPDQMQLLYYVDDTSYLIDSGYDFVARGSILDGDPLLYLSSWNHYYDHNTMIIRQVERDYDGGLRTPTLQPSPTHPRLVSEHQNVDYIFGVTDGRITELSSALSLEANEERDIRVEFADYRRVVLFIADELNPYLLDINSVARKITDVMPSWFKMSYWGNSEDTTRVDRSGQRAFLWNDLYKSETDKINPESTDDSLFVQPFTMEAPASVSFRPDSVRESFVNTTRGRGIGVGVLEVETTVSHPDAFTTVAYIHALPDGTEARPLAKANRVPPREGLIPTWDYFTLSHSASEVDVLVVQNAKGFISPSLQAPERYALIRETNSPIYAHLPAGRAYGFARLENTGGTWAINTNYEINLQLVEKPLEASMGGPGCIEEGTEGYYSADAAWGRPPYSYDWEWLRICSENTREPTCNEWHALGGGDSSVLYGGHNGEDFKIRVTVTDSASPRESKTLTTSQVEVLSMTEGTCPSDGGISSQSVVESVEGEEEIGPQEADKLQDEVLDEVDGSLEQAVQIPKEYRLEQNYPNPFNSETVLRFELPKATTVWLTVFDVLGRQIAVPVAGIHMAAGVHQVGFSAANVSSGHYFYHLRTDDYSSIQKMIVAK